MSSPQQLPFAVPFAVMGLPAGTSGDVTKSAKQAANAAKGGDPCFEWVFQYAAVAQLAQRLPENAPVNPKSEYGDFSFNVDVPPDHSTPGVSVTIQSSTQMDQDVVNGTSQPDSVTYNGQSYNIVGSIEATIEFNGVTAWSVALPLTLLSAVPVTVLGKIAFSAFLKPIIAKIYSGIRSALQTNVEEGMDDAAVDAAADAAADVAEISEEVIEEGAVDATLSLETGGLALVGFVALIVIQIGIDLLVHPSYHQLIIYNFTPYDIKWQPPYLEHDATITLEPVTNTTGNTPANTLPGMSEASPSKHIAPVNTASMAQFNVYSDSEVYGAKWGLQFMIEEVGISQAAAMWDIPLGGDNSISATLEMDEPNIKKWVDKQDGQHKVLTIDDSLGVGEGQELTIRNSMDYLDGKHPMAPGSKNTGYVYRSVLAFQMTTQS